MTIRSLTEFAARKEWAGGMMVVREDRDLLQDIKLFVTRTVAALCLLFPLWHPHMALFDAIPYAVMLVGAAVFFVISMFIAADLKAARASSSWLMAVSKKRIWLNMRSWHHFDWPRTHEVVLAIDHDDVDVIYAARIGHGQGAQLAVRLKEPLAPELVQVLMDENTRRQKNGRKRSRYDHQPIRLEENSKTLRIMFGETQPKLGAVLDKLRLAYDVAPTRNLSAPDALLLENRMEINDQVFAEIVEMLREGETPADAAKYLHQRTGERLTDCRAVVDGFVESLDNQSASDPQGSA